jgi:8-oxo-dGTP diphosphatase
MESVNSVDCIVDINNTHVILVKRDKEPFSGYWALPGCQQKQYEELQNAVLRVLKERLNLNAEFDEAGKISIEGLKHKTTLHQIKTYDSGTDPRGGNTTVFAIHIFADVEKIKGLLKIGEYVTEQTIFDRHKLPKLAFEHHKFIDEYYKQLKPYDSTKESYDITKYEKPSVSVDIVVFSIRDNNLKILLIKRKSWPFRDTWAIPGGFINMKEDLKDAAKRELMEETNVKDVYLEQLYTFGKPGRDPRTRVITVAYFALINSDGVELKATTDASEVKWFTVNDLPKLAFDHNEMIDYSKKRLRWKLEYTTIAFQLLPKKFTLTQLQNIYEIVFDKSFDKRNFRKKMFALNILKETNEMLSDVAHRPAKLYTLKTKIGEMIEIL